MKSTVEDRSCLHNAGAILKNFQVEASSNISPISDPDRTFGKVFVIVRSADKDEAAAAAMALVAGCLR